MSITYDVIVVGSGPAGACAAWGLAKAGVAHGKARADQNH